MAPTVIGSSPESNVQEWAPLRAFWFFQEHHSRLVGQTIPLAGVAGNARADDIFPGGLAPAIARKDMIDIKPTAIEADAAVLAGVLVPLEDIMTRELDLFLGKAVEEA